MSDSIMQKIDEMQALTYSSSVPLGVSIARHADRLLAETRLELSACIAALKVVLESHSPLEVECFEWDCVEGECHHDATSCLTVKVTLCEACYRLAADAWPHYEENGYGEVLYPCPTVKAITKALGVES